MSLAAIILIVLSAFLHAGWNLAGKKGNPSITFFFIATLIGIGVLIPFPIIYRSVFQFISFRVWLLIITTGLCQALYYTGLAGAYRRGDMSIAYPMARSLPIVLVALSSLALGRGDSFTAIALGGIGLIAVGAFILPMNHFRDFKLSNYFNKSNLFALLAALSTVFYSLIDDSALRIIRTAADGVNESWQVAMVYVFFEGLSASLCMGVFLLLRRLISKKAGPALSENLKIKAITGIGIYITYSLVLISMAFVRDVSYVVAFRQMSLPIGVVLGIVILKESAHIPKFIGIAMIFTGLILVGIG